MAKITLRSNVAWSGNGVQSLATLGQHRLVMDEPPALGGADQGPEAIHVILAALGGCLNTLVAAFAPQHGVELTSVKTRIEGDLDPDGFLGLADVPFGYQEIRYHINIESPSPADNVERLIAHALRVCPVRNSLQGTPVVELEQTA